MIMSEFFKKMNIACLMFFCLSMFFFHSCKDEAGNSNEYDPGKPVEVTGFTPKNGSAKTRMHIYGKNFGTDVSRISVKIGGLPAKVIGSNGEIIYCLVPYRAIGGTVEVAVGSDAEYITADESFVYHSKNIFYTHSGYFEPTGQK